MYDNDNDIFPHNFDSNSTIKKKNRVLHFVSLFLLKIFFMQTGKYENHFIFNENHFIINEVGTIFMFNL